MAKIDAIVRGCDAPAGVLALHGAMITDLAIVVLGPPCQRIAEIVAQPVGIQFVDRAETVIADDRLQQIVADEEFVVAVQIEIDDGQVAGRGLVEQCLQFDQCVPYRPAQMRQIEPAEQSVPVGVIGLREMQQLAHVGRRLGAEFGNARRKLLHALVHPVRFGVTRHEVAPDAASHEGFRLLVVLLVFFPPHQFGIAVRAIGIERPFVHFDVRGGRQIDHTPGALPGVEVAIQRGLDRRGGDHAFDELLEPLFLVNPDVGFRPDAQLLDVVEIDCGRGAVLGRQRFQVLDRLGCGGKRDPVAQRLRNRKQVETAAAFFRREIAGQLLAALSRAEKVIVVHGDVTDGAVGQR